MSVIREFATVLFPPSESRTLRVTRESSQERAFTRSREGVCVCRKDARWPNKPWLYKPSDERPPTRFTTLSCNYHHKVDFTSSKSPRKGMLHFARTTALLTPPNADTPNNPSFDYPGATTSPTGNHLGRLSVLPPFESLPATSLSSSSRHTLRDIRGR